MMGGKYSLLSLTRSQWDRVFILSGSALAVTIFTILLLSGAMYGYGFTFQGANVTDGLLRTAAITEEDGSVSIYSTVNGSTVKVDGYDSFRDFIDAKSAHFYNLDNDRERYNERLLASQMQQLSTSITKLDKTLQEFMSQLSSMANQFLAPLLWNDVFATAVNIADPNDLSDVHINFTALFNNGTTATLDQNITRTQGDLLVTLLNGVVNKDIDPDKLQNLDLGMELPEEETEEETEETEDNQGGGGGGNDDNGGFNPDEPLPPGITPELNPLPGDENNPPSDDGGGEGDTGDGGEGA